MDHSILVVLDWFFIIFHSLIIVFSLTGWLIKPARLAHVIVLFCITFSWLVLGINHGFGYCFLTEWHWNVKMKLGHYDMPSSYTKYLFTSLTGLDVNTRLIDWATVLGYIFSLLMALIVSLRSVINDRTKKGQL